MASSMSKVYSSLFLKRQPQPLCLKINNLSHRNSVYAERLKISDMSLFNSNLKGKPHPVALDSVRAALI